MHLTQLKNTPVSELVEMGENQMGLENLARLRKQDIIFAILKQHAKAVKTSSDKACLKFCRMVSVSSAHRIAHT